MPNSNPEHQLVDNRDGEGVYIAGLDRELSDDELMEVHEALAADVLDRLLWIAEWGDPLGERGELLARAAMLDIPPSALRAHGHG
jgi:hypothetical protein